MAPGLDRALERSLAQVCVVRVKESGRMGDGDLWW